jgi:hypothetical protein
MAFEDGGKYVAECIAAELTSSPTTGNDGIELTFQTEEGITTHTLWLTEKNRDQVYRTLSALGVPDPTHFDPLEGDLSLICGASCVLIMGAEEYNGKTRMRVRWINRKAPVKRESVAAYFRRQNQKAPVAATGPDDDDIPF